MKCCRALVTRSIEMLSTAFFVQFCMLWFKKTSKLATWFLFVIFFFISAAQLRSHFLGDRQVLSFMCTFRFKPWKFYFLGFHCLFRSELNISSNATYLFQVSFLKYNINILFLTRGQTCVSLFAVKVLLAEWPLRVHLSCSTSASTRQCVGGNGEGCIPRVMFKCLLE